MRERFSMLLPALVCLLSGTVACEIVDDDISKHTPDGEDSVQVALNAVAGILASVPLDYVHLHEVHAAVSSSSMNGYDEEYTMRDLFVNPGAGVGEPDVESKVAEFMANPLRNLIEAHVRSAAAVKGGGQDFLGDMEPDVFLKALTESDVQIYWPFSENWDGRTFPVVTFDPEDGGETNIGYRLVEDAEGNRTIEEIVVDEEMAQSTPVWVVNRNSDACYTSLEMLRREDPDWGEGGGTIIVKPSSAPTSKSSEGILKSLILKDFTMKRNFDPWFAGGSEFFVKTGYVKDFTASTEAELKLYNPTITDFLVVVKRSQVGIPQPFNAMLVSEWSEQMTHCAFMITEDDGGTKSEWKCTALVRIASKSYGVELSLPFNSRDDYVWRGQLSNRWLAENSDITSHFGDVDLTFEVVESGH
ncbi:MAG: hypothetical protein ACI3ZL_03220 [Candidatus Cryptobacteroides sp.]